MKNIIMQQNKFIENITSVTIQGIKHENEDEVKYIFSESLSFTGIERTRKYKVGIYLLIIMIINLQRTQHETDQLLRKYFPDIKNHTTDSSRPSRIPPKIKHNHFSNYAATLSLSLSLSQLVNEPIENRISYLSLS